MILGFFLLLISDVIGLLLGFLPDIVTLPFNLDVNLSNAVGYWNSFLLEFWFLQPLWHVFLWYMELKLSLIVLKFFLGSRVPTL